jgi:hypothetical protein
LRKTAPFKTKEPIITSKRWEAWREGVEDWQYLLMLEKEIRKAEKKKDMKVANDNKKILQEEVKKVLSDKGNSLLAERARERIIEEIIRLRGK